MRAAFIKLQRSEATWELLQDGNAFVLLTQIALRAKRTGEFSVHGLRIGQALIGDYRACGLTEQEYRSAKIRLTRYGLATFKATSRGTIATLLDSSVYDINPCEEQRPNNGHVTDDQRTGNEQITTNKNDKNERTLAPSADADRLGALIEIDRYA